MRAVVQRVNFSSVEVDGVIVGTVKKGLNVLLGVGEGDTQKDVEYMVEKICGLRIFEDADDKMNLSLLDVGGEMLCISQFTLYGDVRKGKRPSFSSAAKPEEANLLYESFMEAVKGKGITVQKGTFGAHMIVDIQNDGPVTIMLDSQRNF
ncbi:D-aminoacyl-tRNA deacylase [Fusibacter ferrireducens]|uniref:D-aminoacyl-tRNA deacylase n=1 Tax=Fusibacter ferrireducens TaxID=2785058 RepID=A0ABR9ZTG2_9FIRM|nr:D-aminoacyl-tRNA deacylase [Fusibacter ferrireducens]MBF4693740.1 D-tyrosyl-tRNA(Tyr) deacylase [Fusibacter ferrireducens]